jgi:hypothetical protein
MNINTIVSLLTVFLRLIDRMEVKERDRADKHLAEFRSAIDDSTAKAARILAEGQQKAAAAVEKQRDRVDNAETASRLSATLRGVLEG